MYMDLEVLGDIRYGLTKSNQYIVNLLDNRL